MAATEHRTAEPEERGQREARAGVRGSGEEERARCDEVLEVGKERAAYIARHGGCGMHLLWKGRESRRFKGRLYMKDKSAS